MSRTHPDRKNDSSDNAVTIFPVWTHSKPHLALRPDQGRTNDYGDVRLVLRVGLFVEPGHKREKNGLSASSFFFSSHELLIFASSGNNAIQRDVPR